MKLQKAEEKMKELERRTDESETFRTERDGMLKEIEKEKGKAAKQEEMIQVLKKMDDERSKLMEANKMQIGGLNEELEKERKDTEKAKESAASLKKELREMLDKLMDKQSRLTAAENELVQLKEQSVEKDESASLEAIKKEMESKAMELEEKNSQLMERNEKLKEDIAAALASVAEIETSKAAFEKEKAHAVEEIKVLKAQIEDFSKNAEKTAALEAKESIAIAASKNAKEMLEQSQKECEALKIQIKEVDELKQQIKLLEGTKAESIKFAKEETKKFEIASKKFAKGRNCWKTKKQLISKWKA